MKFRVGKDNHEIAPVTLNIGGGAGVSVSLTGDASLWVNLRFTPGQAKLLARKLVQAADAGGRFEDESTDFEDDFDDHGRGRRGEFHDERDTRGNR